MGVCNRFIARKKGGSGMKPVNHEEAKQGKPVCAENGQETRIIHYDMNRKTFEVVALSDDLKLGKVISKHSIEDDYYAMVSFRDVDLMMEPVKREGWINIYLNKRIECNRLYDTKEEAEQFKRADCVATVKIEWEE